MNNKTTSFLNFVSGIGCLAIVALLTMELGFPLNAENRALFSSFHSYIFIFYFFDLLIRLFMGKPVRYIFTHPTDLFILFPFAIELLPSQSLFPVALLEQGSLLIVMLGRLMHINFLFKLLRLKPAQMLLMGFIFAIFIGSLLLSLPIATVDQNLTYVDSLFTATSAVCVTGLVVNDIGMKFTTFGQTVIMLLIQLGGLGIMTFSVLLVMLLNRKVSQRETVEFQQSYATGSMADTYKTIKSIIIFTLLLEAIGAFFLFVFWHNDFSSFGEAVYYSVFHSISAFCNAGFSLFSDSFISYATYAPVILTISFLIIVGGIGFPVMINLYNHFFNKKNTAIIKFHTKITIMVTIFLLILGTIVIYASESNNALSEFNLFEKGLISFFHSVSVRTCGFNSIDLTIFNAGTLFFLIPLMFIGASPGSTGGGIKTTSFGVLIAVCWSTFNSRNKTEVGNRTLKNDDILKVIAIVILSATIIGVFLYLILLSETHSFLDCFFETVSAFGTVGLSLGITKYLSIIGKTFIIILMFIGRVGPLTIAFALSRQKPKTNYSYPEENVLIA
jgi:trk system potassium uptake protein